MTASERPGLLYFSPMPPVRSGIADYSRELLPYLERHYPLVVASGGAAPTPAGWLPVYQMGNNVHHAAIHDRALRVPGLLVLHDYVLHHLLGEVTLREGDEAGYLATVAYGHGAAGAAAAKARLMGVFGDYQQFVFPANALLADRSLACVVHSRHVAAKLRHDHPDLPVFHAPMGVPLPAEPRADDVAAARAALGLPLDAFVVANFGFITPIKRVDTLLGAFARLAARAPGALLCVVGEVSPAVDVAGIAARLGIGGKVVMPGFVPLDTWMRYLVAADVCVNLRFPTAGETSASLLRIMGHGKPVLVSRYAQFRELPSDCVGFVDLGPAEEEILFRFLRLLGEDAALRRDLGDRARRYVATEHTFERAVAGYRRAVDACFAKRDELAARVAARGPQPTGGARTSRVPGTLAARIAVDGRRALPAGSSVRLRPCIDNRGDTVWLRNGGSDRSGFVVLASRFVKGGEPAGPEQWFDLPRDVAPAAKCVVEARLETPTAPGRYELRLDMVDVGFGRMAGGVTIEVAVS